MTVKRYNPRKQMIHRKRILVWVLVVLWIATWHSKAAAAPGREQPSADLAKQIAALAGPGPAKLTIRNHSSLAAEEIPAIRRLLERDLRGYGVIATTAESNTTIRVTLSENAAGGLWIAEVQEGTEVRVVMTSTDLGAAPVVQAAAGITLRKTLLWQQKEPVLDVFMTQTAVARRMIVLEPEHIVSWISTAGTWTKEQDFEIEHTRPFPRDMRGRLLSGQGSGQGHLFDAYLPGVLCTGTETDGKLTISCADSDDPWPLQQSSITPAAIFNTGVVNSIQTAQQKAFYNSTRNYFTGILAPGYGMELPPFYNAVSIPRPSGTAMLFNGIDGKVVIVENNVVKPIAGARDWGSDLASIRSTCGTGTQVLASASGTAATDSLRAYEIPGREAVPASAPLALDGPVTAMWPSIDNTGATVIVETTQPAQYEVYSVSVLCN